MTSDFVCPADHKHATTSTCYNQHTCRCTDCRVAVNARARRRLKDKAYGRYQNRYVPAGPLRDRLHELQSTGIGVKQIAALSGTSRSALAQVVWGRQTRRDGQLRPVTNVLATTAEKVLALHVNIEAMSPGSLVPALPTVRRLQALMVIGYSMPRLAERVGQSSQNFNYFMSATKVSVATHLAIAQLYAELWNVNPPQTEPRDKRSVSQTKAFAAKRDWTPPMGWDDIETDEAPPTLDPDDEPTPQERIDNALAGDLVSLTFTERCNAIEQLHARRLSDPDIAKILRIDKRSVLRIRQRLQLPAAVGADKQRRAA